MANPKIKKPIPLMDKITMSPMEIYKEYDVFPFRFLVHVI